MSVSHPALQSGLSVLEGYGSIQCRAMKPSLGFLNTVRGYRWLTQLHIWIHGPNMAAELRWRAAMGR